MHNVATIILGGGQGKRLFPLTLNRCKPAINFGGRYRLIDVPVSNSIHAHINKIFVITQFLSTSLHKHLLRTFRFDPYSKGFIEILANEERIGGHTPFEGTADAIRKNLSHLLHTPVDYFLILSGDQLYHLDFEKLIKHAQLKDTDLTIATTCVNEEDAKRMGVMKLNSEGFISQFVEKPQNPTPFKLTEKEQKTLNLKDPSKKYLVSMGIYLFKKEALFNLLKEDIREDFGKHLIPSQIQKKPTTAYVHDGYWVDVGDIPTFFEANMALAGNAAPFNCYDTNRLIYTQEHHLPGARIEEAFISSSIVCEGSTVKSAKIQRSILGQRSVVEKGCELSECYIMGNDYYSSPVGNQGSLPQFPKIGSGSQLKRVVVDKNVSIGKNVVLVNKKKLQTLDQHPLYIRNGIIVVSEGAIIKDGFTL